MKTIAQEQRMKTIGSLKPISIFVLCYLLYKAGGMRDGDEPGYPNKEARIYEDTGINNKIGKAALRELERNGLIYWWQGKYQIDQKNLVTLLCCHVEEADANHPAWHLVDGICRVIYSPIQRKLRIGRMDYLDKLLILYLVMSADEQWQVKGFEFKSWASHLGIDKRGLWRRLEALRAPTGFVLAIKKRVYLEEGLGMPWEGITLNPAHPWLLGHRNFYAFCQLGGASFCNSLGLKYSSNLLSDTFMETEGPSLEGFEKYIHHLVYRNGREEISGYLARVQDEQSAKHQRAMAMELLFEACMSTGLFILRDIDINAQKPDLGQIEGLLEKHVLKPAAAGNGAWEMEGLLLLSEYVQALNWGTRWVLERLLEMSQKALASHPDRLVANGRQKARLMHFATNSQWRQLEPEELIWGRVTGIAYFYIESEEHPAVVVQSTPERKDIQIPFNHKWEIAYQGVMIPMRKFYKGSLNNSWAIMYELQRLEPSKLDYVRQVPKPEHFYIPVGWMEYLKEVAKNL